MKLLFTIAVLAISASAQQIAWKPEGCNDQMVQRWNDSLSKWECYTPTAGGSVWGGITGTLATQSDLQTALDARALTSHSHNFTELTGAATDAQIPNNITVDLAATAATGDTATAFFSAGTIENTRLDALVSLLGQTITVGEISASGTPGATTYLRGDGSWQTPASGSDPWTYVSVSPAFTTSSATAVDVTGLAFTPLANTKYLFEGVLMVRTATATVNPRPGLAWATGLTDGVASIDMAQTANTQLNTLGNIAASLLTAVGGLPNTTQSWPVTISGMVVAGASPSGTVKIQMASETAGTVVTVIVGSYLRYRSF